MKYLLDTNVCIAVLRGNPKVIEHLQTLRPEDCGVSTITVFELLSGVERCRHPERERAKVEALLAPLHLLPFDGEAAIRAAEIRGHLERLGQIIGPYDLLLASQALALEVTFVTRNTKEFSRVAGLALEDWESDRRPPSSS